MHEYVENTPIELSYLPRGSPELNPTEEYWRRLNKEPGNRLFRHNWINCEMPPLPHLTLLNRRVFLRTYVRKCQYKQHTLETLLHMALQSSVANRDLLDLLLAHADDDIVFPPERWPAAFRPHAQLILN